MVTRLYVIFDSVAEESGPIFQAKNDAVALRQFGNLQKKEGFSDEFSLWCFGSFDHETMELVSFDPFDVQVHGDPMEDSENGG